MILRIKHSIHIFIIIVIIVEDATMVFKTCHVAKRIGFFTFHIKRLETSFVFSTLKTLTHFTCSTIDNTSRATYTFAATFASGYTFTHIFTASFAVICRLCSTISTGWSIATTFSATSSYDPIRGNLPCSH